MDTTETQPKPMSRPLSAIAGLAAGAFGLGVAELVASSSNRLRSPIIDVGDRVVDNVPPVIKDLAIALFGTNDKLVLLLTIGVLVALLAATIGVVALRRRLIQGLIGVGLFALLGVSAALAARTGTDIVATVPTLVGSATTAIALIALDRMKPSGRLADRGTDPGRRSFVLGVGTLAAAGVAAGVLGRQLTERAGRAMRDALGLPVPASPLAPIDGAAQAPSAAPFITSNEDFYRIDTALEVPRVDLDTWELRVSGMVERPLRFTWEELIERPVVESDITLTCVSNTLGGDLIGTARWLGIRLDDLLADAGIVAGADQIVGRSVDGYTCGFPVDALDGRDALVAIAMNGEPLPLEHGFPARLIVPGIYGYASATKWLTEIELTTFDAFDHYWVPRGYAAEAPIKLQSRIDSPRGLDRIGAGPTVLGGVAWAQPTGISGVDVRVDDGPWQPAELAAEVNGSTWRQWSLPWMATPGRHTISVRATDANGRQQTDERVEPLPDGATGHHTIVVLVDE